MSTQHGHNKHGEGHTNHGGDDAVSPAEQRRQKRMKSMGTVAVVLMLIALVAYVMTNDESTAPGMNGEAMPAIGE